MQRHEAPQRDRVAEERRRQRRLIPPRVRADPFAARRSQALRASPQWVRAKARWYHADRAGAAGTAYKGRPPRLGRVAHRRQGAEGRVHLQLPPTPSASPNLVSRQRLLPVRAQKPWLHRRRRRLRAIRSGLCLRVKSARTNKRLRNQEDRANGPPAFLKSW